MVITDEVFLKLLVVLKHDIHTLDLTSAVFANAKHVTSVKQQLQYYSNIKIYVKGYAAVKLYLCEFHGKLPLVFGVHQ